MLSLSYWLFQPEFWLILGIGLILADVLIGFSFFVLPSGISAGIVSGALWAEQNFWFSDTILLASWREVIVLFAVLSLALIFPIRRIFQSNKPNSDINEY